MSLSKAGKKGAKASPWSRGPNVKRPANWQRMVEWGRVTKKGPRNG